MNDKAGKLGSGFVWLFALGAISGSGAGGIVRWFRAQRWWSPRSR